MKNIFGTFAMLGTAACALAFASCSKGGGGDVGDPTPVITINTHPVAPALTEGAILPGTYLSVEASVTEGATLTWQWYDNTTNSNIGGTAIAGAIASDYALPTDLTAAGSPYYYFCEVKATGAETKRTNVVTVTVLAAPGVNVNEVGKVYYLNGQAVGVVFRAKTNEQPGLVVSLTESSTDEVWSATDFATSATDQNNGSANMTAVENYITTNSGSSWSDLPPFNWVVTTMNGQTSWDAGRDKWYLPSLNEIRELAAAFSGKNYGDITEWAAISPMPGYGDAACVTARSAFNATLTSTGGAALALSDDVWYWTSTEIANVTVYSFNFNLGSASADHKNLTARARAILAY